MRRIVLAFGALLVIAACGGGGGSTPPSTPTPSPTPAPTSTPTAVPATPTPAATTAVSMTTVAVQAQPFSVPLSPAGDVSATMSFPGVQAPPNTTLAVGLMNDDQPSPQSIVRKKDAGSSPIFSFSFTSNNPATIAPGFSGTFGLGAEGSGLSEVQVVVVDVNGNTSTLGIFSVTSGSVTILIPNAIMLTAGGTYTVEVFVAPSNATPSPITTPAPGQINTALSTSASSLITLEDVGGYEGILDFPQVTAGGSCGTPTLTGTYTTSPPSGVSAFTGSSGTLLYLQVTSSCSVVPASPVTAGLTIPSGGLEAAQYANGTYSAISGFSATPVGTASNGETNVNVSFPVSLFSLQAGTPVTIVLYPASSP